MQGQVHRVFMLLGFPFQFHMGIHYIGLEPTTKPCLLNYNLLLKYMTFICRTKIYFLVIKQVEWVSLLPLYPEAYFRSDELSQEVWGYLGHQGHCGNKSQCSDKSQNSGFLRKSIFWVSGGPRKFLGPQR